MKEWRKLIMEELKISDTENNSFYKQSRDEGFCGVHYSGKGEGEQGYIRNPHGRH